MIRLTTVKGNCGHEAPVVLADDPAAAAAAMQAAAVGHLLACPAATETAIDNPNPRP